MLTLEDVYRAKETVGPMAHYTPLDYSTSLSKMTRNAIYMKLENLQKTGSFKVRGAYNKIMSLTPAEKKRGVIAASAGNHAQGVALAAKEAGIKSTIIMPEGAPLAKMEATRGYGAQVILHGNSFDDALRYAQDLRQETGAVFIHAFDDPMIIAGQGTIGLEIVEQCPQVEAIVCPIGGGGLIGGIAAAVKSMKPSVKIYGVEAEACPSMRESLRGKKPLQVGSSGTLADGIAVKRPGNMTYELVERYVDDVFVVSDIEISRTMLFLLERNKLLVEGSGAVSVAAMMYAKIPIAEQNVVAIISGGNVDVNFVSRIIEHGLVEAGRFLHISTTVPDKPGYLNRLLNIISEEQANVISVQHQRISSRIMPGQTEIELALETKNNDHINRIEKKLKDRGYQFTRKT